ncbi:MAG: TetM/TetW/TetO/TetS family tetracycline resistance ribosomal protection protein [Clostridium sp.]|nr:TetM/TetW/TetO/TetS family tetracycline resistance ribosomal protection protein [Acetatifactor muris]MCM1527905.1 TetM/TetW/TetO/TetS family tetracycline resistance ribosomal protection protein [Bacteroides sp.]MCM1564028.1 TetM/TetW/TetO/TetS family tetracycline resistance ribosomal protection protein [Clostridium sp.]
MSETNRCDTREKSNKLVLGILAHVDAGKTTLAESMLYLGGQIRKPGRVDHGDAFLDHFAMERERGITIFSKQARFVWRDLQIVLLDTPGHVDFSAEMERTLQVLDCAVLVVNGADGVQGHTRTLWRLLERYEIPTFIFVNKMDQATADGARLMRELKSGPDENCVAFSKLTYEEIRGGAGKDEHTRNGDLAGGDERTRGCDPAGGDEQSQDGDSMGRLSAACMEEIATCSEELMNAYLERGELTPWEIGEAIAERKVFPCYFGAALRVEGVEALLDGIVRYAPQPAWPQEFGARVFQISRDAGGVRLTHLKVTGGKLRVKMWINNHGGARLEEERFEEKADQIRLCNGTGYEVVEEVAAGDICAVAGLTKTFAGQGLGAETENEVPVLEPVLTYRVEWPGDEDAARVLGFLKQLEEEEPLLHVAWQEESREIHARVMGEVQIEVLRGRMEERFGIRVDFVAGSIAYKETIATAALGIGHFEPLRHYAEVELLLEPGERGSGLQVATLCSEDLLDRNRQRLILTHLEEKVHPGVLTGSPVTDLRVVLVAGRDHVKHTEGGDFRQATYRALRQGLRSAQSILLEPMFAFVLELPTEHLGRAMADVQRMCGTFDTPVTEGVRSVLTGRAPVATMGDYQREVTAYTHGEGHLNCMPDGYDPCHNAEEVIAAKGYDPEGDLENPTGSVFCSHGAGIAVPWNRVAEYAHVEIPEGVRRLLQELVEGKTEKNGADAHDPEGSDAEPDGGGSGDSRRAAGQSEDRGNSRDSGSPTAGYITQEEIDAIFRQTYGGHERDAKRRRRYHVSHRDRLESAGGRRGGDGRSWDSRDGGGNGSAGRGGQSGEKGDRGGAQKSCLLVDGYNIIFAWEELRNLAKVNIDSARDRLMDILSNYRGTLDGELILVFDAYKVKGNPGSVVRYHNIHVVYTKEAETADQYIEKTVHEMADKYRVTVATSDALEQMIVWGAGALRMSAAGLYEAVENASKELREQYTEQDSRIAFRPFVW